MLAEPEVINNIIFTLVAADDPSASGVSRSQTAGPQQNVQLLKHWSQMNGCIFRSIQAPSFRDIIDKNHNLHMFISYLNTVGYNSVGVLQVYLILRKRTTLTNGYQSLKVVADSLISFDQRILSRVMKNKLLLPQLCPRRLQSCSRFKSSRPGASYRRIRSCWRRSNTMTCTAFTKSSRSPSRSKASSRQMTRKAKPCSSSNAVHSWASC